MKKKLFLLILVFCQMSFYAQQDAWVYLTDKVNVAASLQNPITILTQNAIDRKNSQGIIIDERDVPVNEAYISQLKSQTGISVMAKSKWFNAVHVRGTEADINALTALPFVDDIDFADNSLDTSGRSSQQTGKFQMEETLTDFNYGSTQNQVEMIDINALHTLDYTGEGIRIAVLDAGFPNVNTMGAFQRLRDNGDLLNGYDFVTRNPNVYAYTGNTHGTKVLSTMAAYIQDQYVGTAPDASYYLFRTEDIDSENPVEESYWVEAAERADSLGVHVINSSLGYTTYDNPNYSYTNSDMNGSTAYISRGANIAAEKGILVVNSAGNSGNDSWQIVGAPGDAQGVFTIGGVDADGNYVNFSSLGSSVQPTQKPDVVARAGGAFVIDETNTIVSNNGTSFSSPIIAGAVACLMQALPNLNSDQIKQYIRQSASQYNSPDYFLGYGIPDFGMALDNALSIEEAQVENIYLYPNPVKDLLYLQLPSNMEFSQVSIFDITGKQISSRTLNQSVKTLDVSSLHAGIYLLKFQTHNSVVNLKLIKQ
ncbi:MAG: S8 family serine peptidase [Gelidibacter sp.]